MAEPAQAREIQRVSTGSLSRIVAVNGRRARKEKSGEAPNKHASRLKNWEDSVLVLSRAVEWEILKIGEREGRADAGRRSREAGKGALPLPLHKQLTNTSHQGCPDEVCLSPFSSKLCGGLGKCDQFIFQFMLANKINVPRVPQKEFRTLIPLTRANRPDLPATLPRPLPAALKMATPSLHWSSR